MLFIHHHLNYFTKIAFGRSSNTTDRCTCCGRGHTTMFHELLSTHPSSTTMCKQCIDYRIMSAKAKNNTIKPGDEFYETDDDVIQRVVSVHADRDPPVALCRSTKSDEESETEQEYDLKYVQGCVSMRKDFISKGRDLEKIVLSRAVKLHLKRKTMVYNNKTVIFT